MARLFPSIFSVLIVLSCLNLYARPHLHAPDPSIESEQDNNFDVQHDLNNEDVSITKVKSKKKNKGESKEFYPYLESLAPRLGFVLDSDDPKSLIVSLGTTYMFPSYESPHWEAGVDVTSNSLGFIHITKRHIFNERHYFRPFYKYGLAHSIDAEKELGSFVTIENYFLRLSAGLEDVIDKPMSARVELELSVGVDKIYAHILLGYSFAW